MNFSHRPNQVLRVRSAPRYCYQQALGQCLEVESWIEAIGERAEILRCIFSGAKTVVTATQAGLEVSQHRVDPLKLVHILGLAPGHDCALIGTADLGHDAEAGQTVAMDAAASGQAFAGPVCNGFKLEADYHAELDPQWTPTSVRKTAATKATLFSEPRPTLPPTRSPPR